MGCEEGDSISLTLKSLMGITVLLSIKSALRQSYHFYTCRFGRHVAKLADARKLHDCDIVESSCAICNRSIVLSRDPLNTREYFVIER
jgi:hypothetical protein